MADNVYKLAAPRSVRGVSQVAPEQHTGAAVPLAGGRALGGHGFGADLHAVVVPIGRGVVLRSRRVGRLAGLLGGDVA